METPKNQCPVCGQKTVENTEFGYACPCSFNLNHNEENEKHPKQNAVGAPE